MALKFIEENPDKRIFVSCHADRAGSLRQLVSDMLTTRPAETALKKKSGFPCNGAGAWVDGAAARSGSRQPRVVRRNRAAANWSLEPRGST